TALGYHQYGKLSKNGRRTRYRGQWGLSTFAVAQTVQYENVDHGYHGRKQHSGRRWGHGRDRDPGHGKLHHTTRQCRGPGSLAWALAGHPYGQYRIGDRTPPGHG